MLSNRFKTFVEIAAVFAVFFIFGAWKVPDVNEAHYICKAIHYWQPDWIPGDPFLESRDAHWTFYFAFGWLSFFFSPTAMAWIGRSVAWGLMAWSWQRLSVALLPVRWAAIPTALALAYYIEAFNMAGEWLIGGIEGKSLAYPFVFFALEAMLRRRWNHVGIFLGVACAFHILVGGWVTMIVGVLFFIDGRWVERRRTADGRRQQKGGDGVAGKDISNKGATDVGLSRPQSVAEGNGFDGGNLSSGEKTAERGDLCFVRPDETVGGLHPVEHSGGEGQEFQQRIHPIPAHSKGIEVGIGNATSDKCQSGLSDRIGYSTSNGNEQRNRQHVNCADKSFAITSAAVCRPPSAVLNFPWIGIIIGGLLALCGLLPALMLNAGTSAAVINEANQIYVFQRLSHHLVPYSMKDSLVLRFVLLTMIWILLCRQGGRRQRTFNAFIWGTLGLAAIGMILAYGLRGNEKLSAEILRFYWFRLSDIAVPMGVAIGTVRWCLLRMKAGSAMKWSDRINTEYRLNMPSFSKVLGISITIAVIYFAATYICFGWLKFTPDANVAWAITLLVCLGVSAAVCRLPSAVCLIYIALAFYAPLTALPKYADLRIHSGQCRTDMVGPNGKRTPAEWQDICQWIQENTPKTAKFWIPRNDQTFKWHAQRSDIGTWKNTPQDAESIVKWSAAMKELYNYKNAEGEKAMDRLITSLVNSKTEEDIVAMQRKYGFDYILCAQSYEMPCHANLEMVYENDVYCLYRVLL